MGQEDIAITNYKRFCALEGSDYIASEFALSTILRLIKEFNVANILELGLGIGSVSDTILKFSKISNFTIKYVGTEKNEFCLKVLPQNVKDYNKIQIYPELNQIKKKDFDLIIIDGSDDSLKEIEKYCSVNAILFIEGGRDAQTKTILNVFPKCLYVNVITLKKNPFYAHEKRSVNSYIGGGQLIFINPTFQMKIYWFKEKTKTFIKRKIRKYRNK
jgi:spore coat polysaccharide biosynthesis predicted glycosyltransferase SpsG